MVIKFDDLRNSYPTAARDSLYNALGGDWPNLVNDPNYQNTCSIRLSVAFKKVGMDIPNKYKEAIEENGSPIIIRVFTMQKFVNERFGQSYWGASKNPGSAFSNSDMPKISGICAYHANWSDATGHFDLWTGSEFVGSGNFADISDGYSIELWKI